MAEWDDHPMPAATGAPEAGGHAAVDLNALAERVYRLLLKDLRLEIARGAPRSHLHEE